MKKVTIKYESARPGENGRTVFESRTYTFEATEDYVKMLALGLRDKRGLYFHRLESALDFIETIADRSYVYREISIVKVEEGGNDG